MGDANIPTDWTGNYKEFVVKWPDSDQWEAILRGQLNEPSFEIFWDLFSGDPTASIEAMWETFDINLHLQEGSVIPSGLISDYAGGTIPAGWLLCDGSVVSRSTYAALFAAIGTIYGAGNGTTTFGLPEDIGRVKVSLNPGDVNFDTLGQTGGTKTVALTASEMPVHTHVQDSHNHTQNAHSHFPGGVATAFIVAGISNAPVGTGASNWGTRGTTADATATNQAQTATNQNSGGGVNHNNLQPYFVYKSIIKT